MLTAIDRREEFAIHYKDGIAWIAYRYSGGNKDESVYVAGWDMEGKKSGVLYSALRRVLEVQFGRNSDADAMGAIFAPFLSCDQAYIAEQVPDPIRVVLEEFFSSNEINYTTIKAPTLSKKTLNQRWTEAMGEPLQNTKADTGYVLALSLLHRGVKCG